MSGFLQRNPMREQLKIKNCPYCKSPGDLYFKISSKTYNRCSWCDLIYKKNHGSYDKILTHYRNDYFERYSAN